MQKFLVTEKEIEVKLNTIAKIIRGVSHPFICYYISMYLARIGAQTYPKMKNYLILLVDHLAKFKLNDELIKKFNMDIKIDELLHVMEPCFEWIIFCISKNYQNVNIY